MTQNESRNKHIASMIDVSTKEALELYADITGRTVSHVVGSVLSKAAPKLLASLGSYTLSDAKRDMARDAAREAEAAANLKTANERVKAIHGSWRTFSNAIAKGQKPDPAEHELVQRTFEAALTARSKAEAVMLTIAADRVAKFKVPDTQP